MNVSEEKDKIRKMERDIVEMKRARRKAVKDDMPPEVIDSIAARLKQMKESVSAAEAKLQRELRTRRKRR